MPTKPVYSAVANQPSTRSPESGTKLPSPATPSPPSTSAEAAEAARILMGAFADHGKVDPMVFLSLLEGLFKDYPHRVVQLAVKELTRLKWLPSINEVESKLKLFDRLLNPPPQEKPRRFTGFADGRDGDPLGEWVEPLPKRQRTVAEAFDKAGYKPGEGFGGGFCNEQGDKDRRREREVYGRLPTGTTPIRELFMHSLRKQYPHMSEAEVKMFTDKNLGAAHGE